MKNFIKISLLLGIITVVGCQDELDKPPVGAIPKEQADNTPTITILENSVRSSYDMLSNSINLLGNWDWTNGLVFQNDYILQDIASDDMQKKWNPDGDQPWMDQIDNFTFTASNAGPNGLWVYNYEGIKRLNVAISHLTKDNIEAVTGISTDRKEQILAEALFLRSYLYFSLVTNFGDVPLIVRPVESYQEAFDVAVRVDKAIIWDQVKEDLTTAINLLPNSKYSSDSEKWRVSKAAAIALLAKSELYTENWAAVGPLVDQVAALGYSLNANYFDSFTTEFTDNEVVFAFDHQRNAVPKRGNGMMAPLGWGFFAPTQSFIDEFEPNDPRLLYSVNVPNKWINKMLGSLNGANLGDDEAPNNKIYIRYADVLLWKAEALHEQGDQAGAIAIINQIRQRARNGVDANGNIPPAGTLPDRPASSDPAQVKAWLIHERRVELGFENQRLLDLKRWGIAQQVLQAHGKNFQPKHMLYPIPQSEIDASAGTLTQNDY